MLGIVVLHYIDQRGIVLISTLLILSLVSLLTFTSMEELQVQLKMISNYQQHMQTFYLAESALHTAEQSLSNHQIILCMQPQQYNDYYAKQNSRWWQRQKTCHARLGTQYIIERIAVLDCVSFFRITARASMTRGNQVILQSIFAVKNIFSPECQGEAVIPLQAGRQSWREINH